MFMGGIYYNERHAFLEDRAGPKYVGPPEQVVDDAWDEILLGMFICLFIQEIISLL